jgi:hypothetical protein
MLENNLPYQPNILECVLHAELINPLEVQEVGYP